MEDPDQPQPTSEQPSSKSERNWKKILLILIVVLFLISLVGVGIYLLIPKPVGEPTTQPQKQATSEAQPETKRLVWIAGKEIWVKELDKEAEKVLTEDKKILDWDLLGNDKIVYITAIVKAKDEVYGTEIVSLDLKTKEKEVLYEKDLEKILEEGKGSKCFGDYQEDPDISTLSVTKDNKAIIFASSGAWSLDVKSKKATQLLKTEDFITTYGNTCLSYSNLKIASEENIELFTSCYEGCTKSLINLKNKKIIEKYHTGWYSTVTQVSYSPNESVFVKAISYSYTAHGSVIGKGSGEDKYSVDEIFCTTDNYISSVVVEGGNVYFVEVLDDESSDDGLPPYTFSMHVLNLTTKKTSKISDIDLISNNEFAIRCLVVSGSEVYFGVSKDETLQISKIGLKSKMQKLVVTIPESTNEKVVDCFQVTSF